METAKDLALRALKFAQFSAEQAMNYARVALGQVNLAMKLMEEADDKGSNEAQDQPGKAERER